ncbi:MAG: hypothetical protein AABZ60_18390, partial [Planctomycetota bacterium]
RSAKIQLQLTKTTKKANIPNEKKRDFLIASSKNLVLWDKRKSHQKQDLYPLNHFQLNYLFLWFSPVGVIHE